MKRTKQLFCCNHIVLSAGLLVMGALGLDVHAQVPVRPMSQSDIPVIPEDSYQDRESSSRRMPVPVNRVPIKIVPSEQQALPRIISADTPFAVGNGLGVRQEVPIVREQVETENSSRRIPILEMGMPELDKLKNNGVYQVPVGPEESESFAEQPLSSSEKPLDGSPRLDFSAGVPVLPASSVSNRRNAQMHSRIPDFRPMGSNEEDKGVAESAKLLPPKMSKMPPIIRGLPAFRQPKKAAEVVKTKVEKQEAVHPIQKVIFAKRGDQDSAEENNNNTAALKESVPIVQGQMTAEKFENPTKALPVIIRPGTENEIDATRKIMIPLSASNMRKNAPILFTGEPEPISEPAVVPAMDSVKWENSSRRGPGVIQRAPIEVQRATETIQEAVELPRAPVESSYLAPMEQPEVKYLRQAAAIENRQAPTLNAERTAIQNRTAVSQPLNNDLTQQPIALPGDVIDSSPIVEQPKRLSKKELKERIEAFLPTSTNSKETPTKPAKQRFVSNPYVQAQRPATISKSVVEPKARVAAVAKQQEVMPGNSIVTPQVIQNTVDLGIDSGVFPRSPLAVFRGEAIYMTREHGSVSLSDGFSMDPFDHELGFRVHAERIFGVEGRSLTYTGIQEWNGVTRATSAGTLGFDAGAGTGLPASVLMPFRDASFHQQYHNGSMHTLEWNNVSWGWDVLNIFWGLRFTHYEEEFDFFSAKPDSQQGLLALDLENYVFGPQVGGEFFYDVGGLFSTGVKVKLGATANFLDRETLLISNGVRRISNSDTDVDFNFVAELGMFGRMRIGPRAHLRAGYEMWYNSAIYGVQENIERSITPSFGRTSANDDVLIHGATAGFEIFW